MQKDDVEIRLIKLSAFDDRNVLFQLEKLDGKWFAKLIEKTIAEKDLSKKNPPHKLLRKNLNEPKSGWENLFQRLVGEEILTLPNGDEVGNEACPDCQVYIVETKVNGDYRVYDYHAPEGFKNNRESLQLVKIINLISEEFNINVFDVD